MDRLFLYRCFIEKVMSLLFCIDSFSGLSFSHSGDGAKDKKNGKVEMLVTLPQGLPDYFQSPG
jgi:hypothetical protein